MSFQKQRDVKKCGGANQRPMNTVQPVSNVRSSWKYVPFVLPVSDQTSVCSLPGYEFHSSSSGISPSSAGTNVAKFRVKKFCLPSIQPSPLVTISEDEKKKEEKIEREETDVRLSIANPVLSSDKTFVDKLTVTGLKSGRPWSKQPTIFSGGPKITIGMVLKALRWLPLNLNDAADRFSTFLRFASF